MFDVAHSRMSGWNARNGMAKQVVGKHSLQLRAQLGPLAISNGSLEAFIIYRLLLDDGIRMHHLTARE